MILYRHLKGIVMKNIGLIKLEKANVNNFTSSLGIKIRRIINKPNRFILKLATHGKITIESYPKLDKNKPYIFAATHSFVEEISTTLATIDRSAYTLCGTTDQFEHNPKMYMNWLTGVIYVDRYDNESRESSIPKMERVLREGSSILLFPEGGLNNSENLLIQKLFAGPYKLSKKTNIEVVPISTFNEYGSKFIYSSVGEPLELYKYDKEEALRILRDSMATLKYIQIEKHASRVIRQDLPENARELFMEERKNEYLKTLWTHDVWDEELTVYKDKNNPTPQEVRETFDNVNINSKNAGIIGPILVKRLEDQKYDLKSYMHKNWRK